MRETLRQEGLVAQKKIDSLHIQVICEKEDSNRQIECLSSGFLKIASQLGTPNIEFNDCDLTNFPSGYQEDKNFDFSVILGDTIATNIQNPTIRIQLLDSGIKISSDNKKSDNGIKQFSGEPHKVHTPGLATIASALAWQEILRRTGTILPVEIPKQYIDINYRIDKSSIPVGVTIEDFLELYTENDELLEYKIKPREDGSDHVLLTVRSDLGEEIADTVFQKIMLKKTIQENVISKEIEFSIPGLKESMNDDLDNQFEELNVSIVGLGGLGSWTLDTIIDGLKNSNHNGNGLSLNLIDPDLEVERHNLNRQIMYDSGDIGRPKAIVCSEKISNNLPQVNVHAITTRIGLEHMQEILFKDNLTNTDLSDIEVIDLDFCNHENISLGISEKLANSNLIVSCVDNLRTRSILNSISSGIGIYFINAGAGGFNGNFDVISSTDSCMLCRYGKKAISNFKPMSCQVDGEVPFSSIVTSTAIFGALQGLAVLQRIFTNDEGLGDWPEQITWAGRTNSFSVFQKYAGPFNEAYCRKDSNHSIHLVNELMDFDSVNFDI